MKSSQQRNWATLFFTSIKWHFAGAVCAKCALFLITFFEQIAFQWTRKSPKPFAERMLKRFLFCPSSFCLGCNSNQFDAWVVNTHDNWSSIWTETNTKIGHWTLDCVRGMRCLIRTTVYVQIAFYKIERKLYRLNIFACFANLCYRITIIKIEFPKRTCKHTNHDRPHVWKDWNECTIIIAHELKTKAHNNKTAKKKKKWMNQNSNNKFIKMFSFRSVTAL